ncbi:uncharacterized protein NECHADRAFT_37523 [Fusarium vanettenii 77-13-4]|uniref:Nephrocystin 3-like N-terminal domain-containing protein n=1 Tax=Fusarium vanettenii (strain ATCC MYA-4622 / CBS 123669 / FGSC 9596 / NRRL 45880 / 77-13-4) TaxID=660122 RepID=C7YQY3_FUSV7|nr:uncharacterized protein NECHADRAFT_37523 [Fusarium vanettenii 77-13-4]EEU46553.1 hypothetical protein NECHADRAFT_37523 [Fusarium vanettenii 77-13-4]
MGDPLSTAASIAGLMSLADTVFRYVFKYARGAVNAKKEVEALSTEINGLSAVLRGLHALASELEAEASFEPTLRMQHLTHCKQTLETLRNRVKKAADDFDNKTKWEGITRRLKWPFSASETKDLLSDISRCKETLTLATTADTMRKLQIFLTNQADLDLKLDKKLDDVIHILQRDEVDVRKRLILDFFMKPDANPKSNLSQSIKLRHPTTGSWLTTSHAFRAWLDTPGSRLWLNGIPGGGKTVLAGAVVQEALSIGSPDTAVAFFFCDYKNPATLLPLNIIGALASQIARQNDDAFDLLQDYYQELHPARALDRVADVDELRAIIAKMSQLFKQVTVIIDGLDECGENTDSVLESISELAVSTTSTSLALFSRDELNIRTWLHEDFEEISIEAHTEDIELFVRAEMEHRIQNSRLKVNNLKIKDDIAEELITRANGMFRWVVCQLDYLCEFATDADRLNALKELPPTLPDSYRRLLERLNRRPPRVQRMVQMSLQFIAFFPVTLSIKELCQAVSTPQARVDETNTVSERDIVLGCSSLIRKSPDGESLEFAHFSVLEFLQDDLLSKTPGLEAYRLTRREDSQVLATQCLKFLQLDNFNYIPPCSIEWEQFRDEQFQSYPFYESAAIYWPDLAREGLGDSSLLSAAKSLFHPSVAQNFRGWVDLFLRGTFNFLYYSDANYQQNPSKYSLRVRNVSTDQKLRPLHVAAALNLPEICSFLIGEGANVNEVCDMGTPLLLAEFSLFALKDETIDFPDCQWPFLRYFLPCSSRRNRTISCLIEAGASFVKLSELYMSRPLFLTTSIIGSLVKDFGPTIQLLDQCINPTYSEIDDFEAYLKAWARTSHPRELEAPLLNLIRYLKESPAYSTDWGFRLGRALWSTCSKLDLAFTSDPTLTDSRISLSYEALVEKTMVAIRKDDFNALRSYLDDGRVDVHNSYSYGNFHGTLLYFAVRENSPACADQLLALGGDPCSKDDHGRVAVHHCCRHGDGRTLRLLAKFNVSLLAEDGDGNNLWHYSAQKMWTASFLDVLFNLSKDDTWKALLTRNKAGQTPLMIALSRQKRATNEDRENCEWRALMFIDYCNQVPDFWLQHNPLFPTVFKFASSKVFEKLKELGLELDALIPGQATPLHELGPETSIEWAETLKKSYPSACAARFEGKLPIETYFEAILRAGKCPENLKDIIQVLASSDTFKSSHQGTTPWEFACRLQLQVGDWGEKKDMFCKGGWRVLDRIWADLLSCGAMEAFEDAHACTPPLVVGLCKTGSGKAFLQSLLNHSNSERLREFPPGPQMLSLLHRVASSSDEPGLGWLIRELVAKGADINAMNPSLDPGLRVPPIAYHVWADSSYCATSLLQMGADPSLGSVYDAIYFATMRVNMALLEAILDYSRAGNGKIDWTKSYHWKVNGVYWEGTNLHYACYLGHLECTKFFIEEGLIGLETVESTGHTPLHFAAISGSADIIDYLVLKGSGVNVMASTANYTPLHFAAHAGHLEATKALVRLDASNSINVNGLSPRMCAEFQGHHKIVQFLDGAFQDLNHSEQQAKIIRARTRRKRMKEAIEAGDLAACRTCLDDGCPLDEGILGTGFCSPLSYALIKGQEGIAQLFIERNASTLVPFIQENHFYSGALNYASSRRELVLILPSLLSRHLEEGDSMHGFACPLWHAVGARNEEGVRLILEHLLENSGRIGHMNQVPSEKVVVQIVNLLYSFFMRNKPTMMTALHCAVRNESTTIAKLLVQYGANVDSIDEDGASPLDGALDRETAALQASDILERPSDLSPRDMPREYLMSVLALEANGLASFVHRREDGALMDLFQRTSVGQSFILNSEFSLEDMGPFAWYAETRQSFGRLPFLNKTFHQLQRRFPRESLKRWLNLEPDRGWSPLCRAASQDLITIMENCLSLDAEINFEGCPLGSALMIASACGRLEAVKFLVRRGATSSYIGRRGSIDVLSVARSASVRSWLMVGRFNEQLRISMGEVTNSSSTAQTFPWSGIAQAKFRHVGVDKRVLGQSTLDYARALAALKRRMRGQIAVRIDGLVYPHQGSTSNTRALVSMLEGNIEE